MIITRTPLRMSFVGGGSDMPSFYKKSKGAVISTSINKYIYIVLQKKFDQDIRVSYSITENVNKTNQIQHPIVRNILNLYDINGGVEIVSIADIPSNGSGLGSSSSFTVGMLKAINKYLDKKITNYNIADIATYVEIQMCKEPIGKQDQFAAAVGGLNYIEFNKNDVVEITPIKLNKENYVRFENQILLFYTGIARSASKILKEQSKNLLKKDKFDIMKQMVKLTKNFKSSLEDYDLESLGAILDQNWKLKKLLAENISNNDIDNMIDKSKALGAIGAKILGAGNGGFLMVLADQKKHPNIINNLGLEHIPIKFDLFGSSVIDTDEHFNKN